jgi:hypothetical protein
MGDDGIQGAVRCKRTHVDLIEEVVPERDAEPVFVLPRKMNGHHLGRSVHALRLVTGCRIRTLRFPVQAKKITASGRDIPQNSPEVSSVIRAEPFHPFFRREDVHVHAAPERGPDAEPARPFAQIGGP